MVFKCCVKECKTASKNGLHSFPSNKPVAEKWIKAAKPKRALELIDLLNKGKLSRSFHKVCKKHFIESDFLLNVDGKSQLVPNSVPSLFLPGETVNLTLTNNNSLKTLELLERQSEPLNSNINSIEQSDSLESNNGECEDMNEVTRVVVNTLPGNIKRSDRRFKTTIRKITEHSKLLRQLRYYKNRVKQLKLNDARVISYLSKLFNKQQLEYTKMQITNCRRTKHGRRYSAEQKSLCLASYKQSPKSYRFHEPWWILPTKKTLGRHSANLLFKSGVDNHLLEVIKNTVKDWPESDKYCVMAWDEVSLDEHLDYCHSQDFIEGFVELAESRIPKFATHALTFMVRGINISFKQALGFFYTNGLKAFELAELVILMVEALLTTGMIPILSVCDQAGTNASTINTLINPSNPSQAQRGELLMYTITGHKIIHVFDPSHLIKTWRNNLETKNLVHYISERWQMGETKNIEPSSLKIATWDHISALYNMDLQSTQRRLPKLTAEHLAPKKLKMKVSLATELFSNTCGSVMLECIEKEKLPKQFDYTAQLLLFLNDLFDSLNGAEGEQKNPLKKAVIENSAHFEFWEYSLAILHKMFFIDKATGDINNRSSIIKKTESTIRGYVEFSKLCFKLNIKKVSIRYRASISPIITDPMIQCFLNHMRIVFNSWFSSAALH